MAVRRKENRHFTIPWVTLYVAVLIPAFTWLSSVVPPSIRGSGLFIWLTSPFNIYFELASSGIMYNYVVVVVLFLFAEVYSRRIADIKNAVPLMDNAFAIGVVSSYVTSAIVWLYMGIPSAGTSIIAFDILLFTIFETLDSEFIDRVSDSDMKIRKMASIISVTLAVVIFLSSALFYFYLDMNGSYWYVHFCGGAIFVFLYVIYLFLARSTVEKGERAVKRDVEKVGKGVIAEEKKVGRAIERDASRIENEIESDL